VQGAYLGNNIGIMCTAQGTWLGDKNIDKALAAWDKLPATERKPGAVQIEDRGPFDPTKSVVPPPEGLIVREFYRELAKDDKDQLCAPRVRTELRTDEGTRCEILEEPNRDFLWLTKAEWEALAPKTPKEGDTFPLPAPVRDRLLCFHLIDAAKGIQGPWTREQIRKGELTLTVTAVSPEKISLRMEGIILLADNPETAKAQAVLDARLLGYLEYDRKARAWTRFSVVAVGPYRGTRGDCQGLAMNKKVQATLGFAFELLPSDPLAQSVPPRGTRLENGTSRSMDDYFRDALGKIQPDRAK
jgi:hypothetical protein